MKRIISLVAILTIFSFSMEAGTPYAKLWNKVQRAEKAGKPQTAATYLRQLEEKAVAAGDELEHLAVAERLYENLGKYNWKEANAYWPEYSVLERRILSDSLDAYIVRHKDHPRIMMLLYRQLCNHRQEVDRKFAPTGEDYLRVRDEARTLLRHPKAGDYKLRLRDFIDALERPALSSSQLRTMAPQEGVSYTLYARNVTKVEVEVLRNGRHFSSQTVTGFRNEFNISEKKNVLIDFPGPGIYEVRFSAGGGASCSDEVHVSRVAGALRMREGRVEVYAADLLTGKPFGGAKLSLYRDLELKKAADLLTLRPFALNSVSGEGFISSGLEFNADERHDWQLRISRGSDFYAPPIYIPFWKEDRMSDDSMYEQMQLFTDRALYRPEDTIRFKIICFRAGQTRGEVIPGREVEVRLRHISGKEPAASERCVTNDMGSAAGAFTLPAGSRNGVYVIETERGQLGRVRVEAYSRPTFTVALDPVSEAYAYGDVVRQGGELRSFAGYSVAGGEIAYEVVRTSHDRTHGRYLGQEKVAEGRTVADADGRFDMVFRTSRPSAELPSDALLRSDYRIRVTASDAQGETHEAGISVPVADEPVEIAINLPDNQYAGKRLLVDKDRTHDVTVAGHTLNGTPFDLDGAWRLFDADSALVASGNFSANVPVGFDFASLASGSYRMEASAEYRGHTLKAIREVLVFSTFDSVLPFRERFFYYPVEHENAITFVVGTSEDDLYLEMELFDGDRQLHREGLHLSNEMRRIDLPYLAEYRSAVTLSLFGFRGGEVIDRSDEFRRPGDVRLDVAIETLRDKTTTRTEETLTVRAPEGSELVVSVYDITNDRLGANSFDFHPLQETVRAGRPSIRTSLNPRYLPTRTMVMATKAAEAGGAVLNDALDLSVAEESSESEEEEVPEFEGRSEFNELLAFYPQLQADPSGRTVIPFRTGDLLGTFRVLVSAHDRDMHAGGDESRFVVRQELMVRPSLPQFVTEGDRIVLKAALINLGNRELKGKAYIELSDAAGKKLKLKGTQSASRTLLAGSQSEVAWGIVVPGGTDRLTVKIWFDATGTSDGEVHEMAVLPATVTLTEAASFILGGPHDHKYYERQLRKRFGASDPKIEYAEYSTLDAVKESLPNASAPAANNSVAWAGQLYINQMRCFVLRGDPAAYRAFRDEAFSCLLALQCGDGGLAWFQGMKSNRLLTCYVLEKLGQLRSLGALTLEAEEETAVARMLEYLDAQVARAGQQKGFRAFSLVREFSVRSRWWDVPMSPEAETVYKRFVAATGEGWQDISILEKAQLSGMMLRAAGTRYDDRSFKGRIRLLSDSLKDYAVENPTVGCYFPNAVMPFRGLMNSEIYAHSQLIETFSALGERRMVDGIAQWLLLQKHNQAWESTVATADAVHAIVASRASDLKFGAVYYTYTTRLDLVKASGDELKVERTFLRADTGEALQEGESLHAGDRIIARYRIQNSENRSFVQMQARRPACFYPADERSYFSWRGFYREVTPAATNFYWELLPEEITTVEEIFHVQQEGVFCAGLAEIECLYAREYRGHTESIDITSAKR